MPFLWRPDHDPNFQGWLGTPKRSNSLAELVEGGPPFHQQWRYDHVPQPDWQFRPPIVTQYLPAVGQPAFTTQYHFFFDDFLPPLVAPPPNLVAIINPQPPAPLQPPGGGKRYKPPTNYLPPPPYDEKPRTPVRPIWDRGGKVEEKAPAPAVINPGPPSRPPASLFDANAAASALSPAQLPTLQDYAVPDALAYGRHLESVRQQSIAKDDETIQMLMEALDEHERTEALAALKALGLLGE